MTGLVAEKTEEKKRREGGETKQPISAGGHPPLWSIIREQLPLLLPVRQMAERGAHHGSEWEDTRRANWKCQNKSYPLMLHLYYILYLIFTRGTSSREGQRCSQYRQRKWHKFNQWGKILYKLLVSGANDDVFAFGGGAGLYVFDYLFCNESTLQIFFTRSTMLLHLPTMSGCHFWRDSWSRCHRKKNEQCSRTKGTVSRSQRQWELHPPWRVSHLHIL